MSTPQRRTWTILHTESSTGWGGQEIRIMTEVEGMRHLGHRVLIAATPGSRILDEAAARRVEWAAVEMAGWRTPVGIKQLLDLIRRERVEIVNTHSSRDSWLASIAAKLSTRRPILIRTRHLSTPIDRSPVTRFLYDVLPDAVMTTGESIRKTMIERHGFDGGKIVSIPTGVDTAVFSRGGVASTFRAEHGIPEGVPLVGIIAVLRSWKGHEDFLDAARIVRETCPDVRFVIVGDGPRAENIRDHIGRLGLSAAVTMTGHRKDVASVLAALDVFVLSSFGHEGVPQAVLQALAMEVPVVATDVGAVSEVVRDGETGLLARPRAPEELAGRILRLLRREDLRRVVTATGRRLIEDRYRLDLMLARIGALYDDLARRRRRAAESPAHEVRGW